MRITLKEPYAPFLNHLANPTFTAILAREVEEKFKDFNNPDGVIGTGPFVLKSYERGVRLVFERNPDYFMKGLPYLDGVVIEITPDAATRLSLLRAGKVDFNHMWAWASPEEAKSIQKTNPEISTTPTPVIGQGIIYFRTDQPPFNDVRVRRAVVAGHRPEGLERRADLRRGLHRHGPGAVRHEGLEARGVEDGRGQGQVPRRATTPPRPSASSPRPVTERPRRPRLFHWPGYAPPWRSYYELAVDNLSKIGITVELKPEEYGAYISTTYLGKFEKMAIVPSPRSREVDDFLYGALLPGAAGQPQPGRRRRSQQAPRRAAEGAGPEEAQGDRRRHPALRRRQGLLRLPPDPAPVHLTTRR